MATSPSTIEFLSEQLTKAGDITSRKMFGEYALYCDTKIFALVCDDQLFIKPTNISSQFLNDSHLAPPYPGAKNYYRVPEDKWNDTDWLVTFVKQTVQELPLPKRKKRKTTII